MDKIIIIAEAGVNHNGNIDLAYRMIDEAKKCGADIIKFQTAIPEKVISRYAEKAEYQKKTTDARESQLEMAKKIHLKLEDYIPIKEYCKKTGIQFLSSPFDLQSIDFLNEIGCDMWKIPSGEITNYPYLLKIAKTNKPVILSTGMSTINEIREAINILKSFRDINIVLLHCTTEYPAPFSEVNLNVMDTLRKAFGLKVGYSDHTTGIEIPIAAAALGATVIEKHFTLNRKMEGPDHKASLEPEELRRMICSIRNVETAMGSYIKEPTESEKKNMTIARKSIVASSFIAEGSAFTENNITTKRPGNGVSPMRWNEVLGKTAKRDFKEDELIEI